MGIAHNMVVLTHAIDPSGVAFYKYVPKTGGKV